VFRRKPLPGLFKKENSRLDGSDGAFHLLSNQPLIHSRAAVCATYVVCGHPRAAAAGPVISFASVGPRDPGNRSVPCGGAAAALFLRWRGKLLIRPFKPITCSGGRGQSSAPPPLERSFNVKGYRSAQAPGYWSPLKGPQRARSFKGPWLLAVVSGNQRWRLVRPPGSTGTLQPASPARTGGLPRLGEGARARSGWGLERIGGSSEARP
jgi:hypothetical protein